MHSKSILALSERPSRSSQLGTRSIPAQNGIVFLDLSGENGQSMVPRMTGHTNP